MKNLEKIKSKIVNKENLKLILEKEKRKKIVFTNGCFDIIHRGHIEYLSKAADYGDILIIGLNSDKSVSKLKGKNRPLQDETSRSEILAAIEFVNFVVIFDDDTPLNLIKFLKPNILIKGSDYKISEIVGGDFVLKNGGEVITIDFIDGYSTSNIVDKITKH